MNFGKSWMEVLGQSVSRKAQHNPWLACGYFRNFTHGTDRPVVSKIKLPKTLKKKTQVYGFSVFRQSRTRNPYFTISRQQLLLFLSLDSRERTPKAKEGNHGGRYDNEWNWVSGGRGWYWSLSRRSQLHSASSWRKFWNH